MPLKFLNSLINSFGFTSWADFAGTFSGLKYSKIGVILITTITTIVTVLLAFIKETHDFIGNHIFSPQTILYAVCGVLIIDWGIATIGSLSKKEWRSDKAKRIIPSLTANILVLGILFQVSKAYAVSNPGISAFYANISTAASVWMINVQLLSIVANLERYKVINSKIVQKITGYIDNYKNDK